MRQMDNFFITTGRKTDGNCIAKAHFLAEKYHARFVYRNNKSLPQIKKELNSTIAVVVKKGKISVNTSSGELFFHPNMAQLRIKKLLKNENDNMLTAMDLKQGMSVLDCTLGFASDALVSAFQSKSLVIGLESNPLISLITAEGLGLFPFSTEETAKAAANIRVINTDYGEYLKKIPDKSIDIVYFDPMFRHPLTNSLSFNPLRTLANMSAITPASIQAACRVARHRVVLKENSKSHEFHRLGFPLICGGRYSSIHYGIIKIK